MILKISAKCSDLCEATLIDDVGNVLKEHDGYVPNIMPGGGGDYVDLEIDVETGRILNWKRPSSSKLKSFIGVPKQKQRGKTAKEIAWEIAYDRKNGLLDPPVQAAIAIPEPIAVPGPEEAEEGPLLVWLCSDCRTADPNDLAVSSTPQIGQCECCLKAKKLYQYRIDSTDISIDIPTDIPTKTAVQSAVNGTNVNAWSGNAKRT